MTKRATNRNAKPRAKRPTAVDEEQLRELAAKLHVPPEGLREAYAATLLDRSGDSILRRWKRAISETDVALQHLLAAHRSEPQLPAFRAMYGELQRFRVDHELAEARAELARRRAQRSDRDTNEK